MTDMSKIKLKSGWAMDRERFSEHARNVFELAIPYRRAGVKLPVEMLRGVRFNDNDAIFARIESMFTEVEFMTCPGLSIDNALIDAAKSDWYYAYEKDYGYFDEVSDESEIAEDDDE